jgi:hypothetical protein
MMKDNGELQELFDDFNTVDVDSLTENAAFISLMAAAADRLDQMIAALDQPDEVLDHFDFMESTHDQYHKSHFYTFNVELYMLLVSKGLTADQLVSWHKFLHVVGSAIHDEF